MNPLTKVKLINELNAREADLGIKETVSWHAEYKGSAWIFVGGFPYELTEGDIICVFSQYGEIANINLVRDKKTGKSKGFCFICYEDQRSTILAVDNFNGIKIKGRTIRVDHVKDYRPPKDHEDIDDITRQLREEGCAPKAPEPSSSDSEEEEQYLVPVKKLKKDKKEKKKKKKEKKEKKKASKEREASAAVPGPLRVKEERKDSGYDKYHQQRAPEESRRNPQDRQEDWGLRGRHGDQDGERRGGSREEERWREGTGERRRDGIGERGERNGDALDNKKWSREDGENSWREESGERDRKNERREKERVTTTDRSHSRERERDRSRERERERSRERERGRQREHSGEGDRSREREGERDKERNRRRQREHSGEREYRRR